MAGSKSRRLRIVGLNGGRFNSQGGKDLGLNCASKSRMGLNRGWGAGHPSMWFRGAALYCATLATRSIQPWSFEPGLFESGVLKSGLFESGFLQSGLLEPGLFE